MTLRYLAEYLSVATGDASVSGPDVAVTTFLGAPTVVGDSARTPDAIAAITGVDTPTVSVEAAPGTIPESVFLDAPTVVGDSAQTPAAVACVAFVDAPPVSVEVAPFDFTCWYGLGVSVTVGVGADPSSIAVFALLDASAATGTAEVAPGAVPISTAVDSPTVVANADVTPAASACITFVDFPAVTGNAEATPDAVACAAFVDSPSVSVEVKPAAVTVETIIGTVDQFRIALPPVGVGADPLDALAVAWLDAPTVDTGSADGNAAPDAIPVVAAVDPAAATVSVEAAPGSAQILTYLDAPTVDSGVTAAIDLEDNFEILLESGSLLLLQAGVWDANITPDPIGAVAFVAQCDWTATGITIGPTLAFPPYAFAGLALHADPFPLDIVVAALADAPLVDTEAAASGPAGIAYFGDPSVTLGGTDGNANPTGFVVGVHPGGQLDPPKMPRPLVSVGANPDTVVPVVAADVPSVPISADVTPDAILVRIPTAMLLLESDSILLMESGDRAAVEEGGMAPIVTGETGAASVSPQAIDVSCGLGVSVGQDVVPEVIMVLIELDEALEQVGPGPQPGRRYSTRRAILTWRTGRSRLVVRS